jgi:hypothetical protein
MGELGVAKDKIFTTEGTEITEGKTGSMMAVALLVKLGIARM